MGHRRILGAQELVSSDSIDRHDRDGRHGRDDHDDPKDHGHVRQIPGWRHRREVLAREFGGWSLKEGFGHEDIGPEHAREFVAVIEAHGRDKGDDADEDKMAFVVHRFGGSVMATVVEECGDHA